MKDGIAGGVKAPFIRYDLHCEWRGKDEADRRGAALCDAFKQEIEAALAEMGQ